jgi:HSP20 family protein
MAKKWIPWKKKDKDNNKDNEDMNVCGSDRKDWDGQDRFPYRKEDRPSPFDSFLSDFSDFNRIEREMDMMIKRAFDGNLGEPGEGGPFIYGYSMRTGPDGKPEIREFSNFDSRKSREVKRLPLKVDHVDNGSCGSCRPYSDSSSNSDTRPDQSGYIAKEPLTDMFECDDTVNVTIELPGLEKDDIDLRATTDRLTINVNTPERKYHKEFDLPCEIKPKNIKATYKNGILDITLKRKKKLVNKVKSKKIKIE